MIQFGSFFGLKEVANLNLKDQIKLEIGWYLDTWNIAYNLLKKVGLIMTDVRHEFIVLHVICWNLHTYLFT